MEWVIIWWYYKLHICVFGGLLIKFQIEIEFDTIDGRSKLSGQHFLKLSVNSVPVSGKLLRWLKRQNSKLFDSRIEFDSIHGWSNLAIQHFLNSVCLELKPSFSVDSSEHLIQCENDTKLKTDYTEL